MNSSNAALSLGEQVRCFNHMASPCLSQDVTFGAHPDTLHLTLDFILSWKEEKILNSLSHTKPAHNYSYGLNL